MKPPGQANPEMPELLSISGICLLIYPTKRQIFSACRERFFPGILSFQVFISIVIAPVQNACRKVIDQPDAPW
jgi:hypothetical protein